jgi:predicted RNase H-like nuclease (RuvC/YqgF family)
LNVGFSAQEVQKIFPECVGTDEDGYLNFNMHAILVAYSNAIKELHQSNNKLQQENALLKSELQELKNELNEIKAYLGFKTQN